MDGYIDVKITINISYRIMKTQTVMTRLKGINPNMLYNWADMIKVITNYRLYKYVINSVWRKSEISENNDSVSILIEKA